VLDVPDVELDAVVPGQCRAAIDLGPAGDPRLHLEPATLARRVALDLVGKGRSRADQAHLAPHDVPELRQLVEGEPPEHSPNPRDARIAAVHRQAGSLSLGPDDHRAQFDELELTAVPADPKLPVEDWAPILELDR